MDDSGGDDHAARLEADRTAAGRVARTLATRLAVELPGVPSQQRGSFRGCRGRTPEGVSAVEYVATARVDLSSPEPGATVLTLLATLGYGDPVTSEVPGGRRWSVVADDFTVTVTTRPGAGEFLLVAVTGACRDIPADEQDDWLGRGVDDLT